MKTTPRSSPIHTWLLIALALSVAVVATSMIPSAADAKPRLVSTEPLAGDPDTPEAPYSGPAKSARIDAMTKIRSTPIADDFSRFRRITLDQYKVLAAYWWLRLRGF